VVIVPSHACTNLRCLPCTVPVSVETQNNFSPIVFEHFPEPHTLRA
jgi:hypothetical protein